jgi:hypothetical protein
MNSDMNLWQSRAVERLETRQISRIESQRNVGVAKIDKERHLSNARVLGVADVATTVIKATVGLGMLRKQAELLCPELSGVFDHEVTTAALAMVGHIDRPGRA